MLRATCLVTGISAGFVISDRGTCAEERIIDLARAATNKTGLIDAGHDRVKLELIDP